MSNSKFIPKSDNSPKNKNIGDSNNDYLGLMGGLISDIESNPFGFFHKIFKDSYENIDRCDLGDGFRLEEAEIPKTYNGVEVKIDRETYYHLYKDGQKISDKYFRISGLSKHKPFENRDFAELLVCEISKYSKKIDPKQLYYLKSDTAIINREGEVVLKRDGLSTPYLKKGIIGVLDNTYYNLVTKEKIAKREYSELESETSYIFEIKKDENGLRRVVSLNYTTGELTYLQ